MSMKKKESITYLHRWDKIWSNKWLNEAELLEATVLMEEDLDLSQNLQDGKLYRNTTQNKSCSVFKKEVKKIIKDTARSNS